MALPLLAAVMIGTQVVGGVMGLVQQHQQNEMAEKMMKQMQDRDKMAMQWLQQQQGGGFPPGQGYPQLQGQA